MHCSTCIRKSPSPDPMDHLRLRNPWRFSSGRISSLWLRRAVVRCILRNSTTFSANKTTTNQTGETNDHHTQPASSGCNSGELTLQLGRIDLREIPSSSFGDLFQGGFYIVRVCLNIFACPLRHLRI